MINAEFFTAGFVILKFFLGLPSLHQLRA